ncbi:MAG TPA: CHAT domain-containing protein [Chloroflexota bacterium]|jgi:hypothetical protein
MISEAASHTPTRYPDLLVRITPAGDGAYRVELEFTQPGSAAATEPEVSTLSLDLDELASLLNDTHEYARRLSEMFYADPRMEIGFRPARAVADSYNSSLRVRFHIATDAPDLHRVRWELLNLPGGLPMATSERVLFSRYLRSPDFRRVPLQPESGVQALVIIPNPRDLADGRMRAQGVVLQPLDVQRELDIACKGLAGTAITALVGARYADLKADAEIHAVGVTMENIFDYIRQGFQYVYFVGHGAFQGGTTRLYIEDVTGDKTMTVTGQELAEGLAQLRELPTLFVLASCQSAGTAARGALSAVGPLLASAGVPAVLAMQEQISVDTAEIFMEKFFAELRLDGQLDRAAALARWAVKSRPDAWMPVLFTRLTDGCLWPRSAHSGTEQEQWTAIIRQIEDGHCTPILGPALLEFLLGSNREIARSWADQYRFPMSPHDRQDLPQVAQFLAVELYPEFPVSELNKHLRDRLIERYGDEPLRHALNGNAEDAVRSLAKDVGIRRRRKERTEPFKVLAKLPFATYITTNPDNLLADALTEAGRTPVVELCRWHDSGDWPDSILEIEPDYTPSLERPLVYHLFGQLRYPDSLVLTEDNYFDYLIGVTRNEKQIPRAITRAWASNALLFLGFQIEEWNFRVLLRRIVSQEGRGHSLVSRREHVAVQLDPEEGTSNDPRRARQYLEKYFQSENIVIRWLNAEQFIADLWFVWQQNHPAS